MICAIAALNRACCPIPGNGTTKSRQEQQHFSGHFLFVCKPASWLVDGSLVTGNTMPPRDPDDDDDDDDDYDDEEEEEEDDEPDDESPVIREPDE